MQEPTDRKCYLTAITWSVWVPANLVRMYAFPYCTVPAQFIRTCALQFLPLDLHTSYGAIALYSRTFCFELQDSNIVTQICQFCNTFQLILIIPEYNDCVRTSGILYWCSPNILCRVPNQVRFSALTLKKGMDKCSWCWSTPLINGLPEIMVSYKKVKTPSSKLYSKVFQRNVYMLFKFKTFISEF